MNVVAGMAMVGSKQYCVSADITLPPDEPRTVSVLGVAVIGDQRYVAGNVVTVPK